MNAEELDKATQILMDNTRKAIEEKREIYESHIKDCGICRCFMGYQGMNDALKGMSPRRCPNMSGMDEFWKNNEEHLKEFGKFTHRPYELLPLIQELKDE